MSSREILFSSPSEEKDGPPASAQTSHGHPLSLHRKLMQPPPSDSGKHLTSDALTSPVRNQASDLPMSVETPLDADLPGDVPEPPVSVLVPELPQPLSTPPPDASVSIPEPPESEPVPEGGKLGVRESHNSIGERRSPRLNGRRQHRPVKKFRPPDNGDTLTPEMGGHCGVRGRRHHFDLQSPDRGQASSPQGGSRAASRSVSKERKRDPGNEEEMEAGTEETEEQSR